MLIPLLIALFLGATRETDALLLAFTILLSLNGMINPIFESALLPYLYEKKQREIDSGFVNGVLIASFPLILSIAALIYFLMPVILPVLCGLRPDIAQMTADLFLKMMPLFILGAFISASNCIFFAQKEFWFPAVSPSIRSLPVILFLVLGAKSYGVYAVAYGFAAGEICRWGIGLWLLIKKAHWRPKAPWKGKTDKIKDFVKQAGFHLAALISLNLIPVTDQFFASWTGKGQLSILSYGERLFQIPYQLFLFGFINVYFSYWSESHAKEPKAVFWEKARKDLGSVRKMALFFTFFMIAASFPLVNLVFYSSELTKSQLNDLCLVFCLYMLGFVPAVLNLMYVRIFFVLKKTVFFFVQSAIRFAFNIVLNYICMKLWGLKGIAAATSIVFLLTNRYNLYYMRKLEGPAKT